LKRVRRVWIDIRFAPIAIGLLIVAATPLPAPISETAETPAPLSEQSQKAKRSKPRSTTERDAAKAKAAPSATPRTSGAARNLNGPAPEYPAEAAAQGLSGSGKYTLHFDQSTGTVTEVTVLQSAGSPLLDDAAIKGFRQWREDPNCAKEVTMTMTFSRTKAPP
jgi:protein TonB